MGRLLWVVGWSRQCCVRLWRAAGAAALKCGTLGQQPLQHACRPDFSAEETSSPAAGQTSFPKETDMRVSEVMTPGVRMVSPEQTISEAARLMAEIDAGALPVGEEAKSWNKRALEI